MKFGTSIRVLLLAPKLEDRTVLHRMIQQTDGLEMAAATMNPYQARDEIVRHSPDLLILAGELPRMSGISFLRSLNRSWPITSVVFTSHQDSYDLLKKASRDLGCSGVFLRPPEGLGAIIEPLRDACLNATFQHRTHKNLSRPGNDRLIAIGASTGGTEALRELLPRLSAPLPPIVIVQHMPGNFTGLFATSLNGICPGFDVAEAENGILPSENVIRLAPGTHHLRLVKTPYGLETRLGLEDPVLHHRPSVNVLFESIARLSGTNVLAILLTGMGADGATGMLRLKQAGAMTLAQSRESCTVFGMPREAIALGAARQECHLRDIPNFIMNWSCQGQKRSMPQSS